MAKLALVPLVAMARLIERTEHRLRVDAKRHLLRLHGLEERGLLPLALLLIQLLLLAECLLLLLLERRARLARLRLLLLDRGDLPLDLGRFVFLRVSPGISQLGGIGRCY